MELKLVEPLNMLVNSFRVEEFVGVTFGVIVVGVILLNAFCPFFP